LRCLRKGTHHSLYFQNSWDLHGGENFVSSVLEFCEPVKETLIAREQYWIDLLHPVLNMNPSAASCLGAKRSFSPEHCAALSEAGKGKHNGPFSPETRWALGAANRGRPAWNKGKHLSDEHCAKISAIQTGRHLSPEWKMALSVALKGRVITPEWRANISAARTGKKMGPLSPEHRAAVSAGRKAYFQRIRESNKTP
jgi:hypothetical protein